MKRQVVVTLIVIQTKNNVVLFQHTYELEYSAKNVALAYFREYFGDEVANDIIGNSADPYNEIFEYCNENNVGIQFSINTSLK